MKIDNVVRRSVFILMAILFANTCFAASWAPIRTSGSGKSGWQPLICQTGKGWQSCEMPVNIALVAAPASLVAIEESTLITATVTDYYGAAIEGSILNWTTTDGAISATQTKTDDKGVASITLTSSKKIGGATITAETIEKDGKSSIFVPFTDKWIAYPSTYTSWMNYGAVYSCTAWSPDPSTVESGTTFTQSANCWQTQIHYRQDRVQSVVTGAIQNKGDPVAEFQAIVVTVTQSAIGTKVSTPTGECLETWSGSTSGPGPGNTWNNTINWPDNNGSYVYYRNRLVYNRVIPLFTRKEMDPGKGLSQAGWDSVVKSHQYDPTFWIYGNDGGIYYPTRQYMTTTLGADTTYDVWWFTGLCVIKFPTN